MSKIERYKMLCEQIKSLTQGETDEVAVMANIAAAIHFIELLLDALRDCCVANSIIVPPFIKYRTSGHNVQLANLPNT